MKAHYPNAHLVAVDRLADLEELLGQLDLSLDLLRPACDAVAAVLDGLPINFMGSSRKGIKAYVLKDSEWLPAHEVEEITDETDPMCGFLKWKMKGESGVTIMSGLAKPRLWAAVADDGSVDYHWLSPVVAE